MLNAILLSNSWRRMSSSLCDISHTFPSCAFDVVSQPSGFVLNSDELGTLELFNSLFPDSNILHLYMFNSNNSQISLTFLFSLAAGVIYLDFNIWITIWITTPFIMQISSHNHFDLLFSYPKPTCSSSFVGKKRKREKETGLN